MSKRKLHLPGMRWLEWIRRPLKKLFLTEYTPELLGFALKYIRPYWHRFAMAVFLFWIYGLINGLVVGSTSLLALRLTDAPLAVEESGKQPLGTPAENSVESWGDSMKRWINDAVDPWLPKANQPITVQQTIGALVLLPLLALLRGVVNFGGRYYMAWSTRKAINDMRVDLFNHFNRLSLDYYQDKSLSDILSRMNSHTRYVDNTFRMGFADLIREPMVVISVFAFLLITNTELLLICLGFAVLMTLPSIFISRMVQHYQRQVVQANVALGHATYEIFTNLNVAQAFGLEDKALIEQAHFVNDENVKSLKLNNTTAGLEPIIRVIVAFWLSCTIMHLVLTGQPLVTLAVLFASVMVLFTPFKKLAGIQKSFALADHPIERIVEFLETEPMVQDRPNALAVHTFEKGLRFEKVTFGYGNEPAILRELDLEIPKGSKIGLAGPSGSGKSSIMNLLLRFYDVREGRITFDERDIRDLRIADLRRQMALVAQDVILFDMSIADNIRLGRPGATDKDVQEAVRHADALDFVQEREDGFESLIGGGGQRLSGGQRQRLAIARAFVRQSPILLLDEATAALDGLAEQRVQHAIDELITGKTVLCIAHRLSTLANMDEIVVLEQGRIVERGDFQGLLRKRGSLFASMAANQGIFPNRTGREK